MSGFDMFDLVPAMFVVFGGLFAVRGVRALASGVAFHRRAVRCLAVVTGIREVQSRSSDSTRT